MATAAPHPRAHVLIAGAGMAGIETALALREFAGDRAAVTMIDPGRRFAIPATATGSAFGIVPSVDVPLARVVARAGAVLRNSRMVGVDAARRLAMLAGGELLRFDSLVVAVGAHPAPHLPEALTFRGHPDVDELRALVEGVVAHAQRGGDSDVVVVIPAGCGWPLAGYEIAQMTREHLVAAGHGDTCRLSVVTAEPVPLAMFGPQAGDAVVRKLRRMGIEITTGATVTAFDWGRLVMADGSVRGADRVVSLPVTRGPAIAGLPMDDEGFARCGPDGMVKGAEHVHVVGDAGTFPLKKGGVACQQADSVAAAIARGLGADVGALPFMPAMPEWVWDGADGWLRRAPGQEGDEDAEVPLRWPVPKVAGRFLSPFLHDLAQTPLVARLSPGA